MRSALLIVTALATAYFAAGRMIMVVCGSVGWDLHPTNLSAVGGACMMVVGALIPARLVWSRWLALLGCVLSWVYFGPGVFFYFEAIAAGEDYFDILLLIPPALLAAATVHAVILLRAEKVRTT